MCGPSPHQVSGTPYSSFGTLQCIHCTGQSGRKVSILSWVARCDTPYIVDLGLLFLFHLPSLFQFQAMCLTRRARCGGHLLK